MLAQMVNKATDVLNGVAVDENHSPDQELGPVVGQWLKTLDNAGLNLCHRKTEKARVTRMVAACGFSVLRDLYAPTASGAIHDAAEGLKQPKGALALPKGEEFKPGEIRALLGVTDRAFQKLVHNRGVLGTGNGRARRFTREVAAKLIAHRNRGLSHRAVNGHCNALRSFCRWAYNRRLIPVIPQFPKKLKEQNDRRIIRRALSLAELTSLEESVRFWGATRGNLPSDLRATLYLVAFRSLLRARALRELLASDCHMKDCTPWILVRSQTDKTGKERKIPIIDQSTVQALTEQVRATPKGKPVFPIPFNIASILRKDLQEAGIPFETEDGVVDLHALRHSGATFLAQSGVALDVIAKVGGWTNLNQFFDRYGHYTVASLADSLRKATS
jgi:integrase